MAFIDLEKGENNESSDFVLGSLTNRLSTIFDDVSAHLPSPALSDCDETSDDEVC